MPLTASVNFCAAPRRPLLENQSPMMSSVDNIGICCTTNGTFAAGGNGKQIFGDCWWLDTEGEASVNSTLSDQSIQAYLASTAGRPGGSRPLANHLHTPPSVITTSDIHRHDQSQVQAWLAHSLTHSLTHPPVHPPARPPARSLAR